MKKAGEAGPFDPSPPSLARPPSLHAQGMGKAGMQIFRYANRSPMPWKNGQGTTTEIAVSPAGAGLDDFDWRLSIARMESDAPFSAFPGIVRTLAIVDGAGLTLAVAGDTPVTLDQASAPHRFAADQPAEGRLLGGPVSNLNIMTRRASCTHFMRRLRFQGNLEVSVTGTLLVLCHSGGIEIGEAQLGPLDCALIEETEKAALHSSAASSAFLIDIFRD